MGPQLVSLEGFSWNSGYSHCWVAPTHVSQWKNINHCKEKVRFKAGPCLRKTGHHRQDVLQEQISLGEEELNSVFGTYSECWIILSSTLHCYLQSLGDSRLKRTRMSTMKVTVLFFFFSWRMATISSVCLHSHCWLMCAYHNHRLNLLFKKNFQTICFDFKIHI